MNFLADIIPRELKGKKDIATPTSLREIIDLKSVEGIYQTANKMVISPLKATNVRAEKFGVKVTPLNKTVLKMNVSNRPSLRWETVFGRSLSELNGTDVLFDIRLADSAMKRMTMEEEKQRTALSGCFLWLLGLKLLLLDEIPNERSHYH